LAVMHTSGCDFRNSYLQMLGATVLFIALAYRGEFDWVAGLILLSALTGMLIYAGLSARRHRNACKITEIDLDGLEGADPDLSWFKIILFLVLGLIGLPLGASLLVEGASNIARSYNITEAVIGLTLVAIGTSLPELATTVVAALRRQADVALGNVIGSNMFNLLGIIGVASLVGPIPVGANFFEFDFWVMFSATLILIPFVFFKLDLTRIWGVMLTSLYLIYMFMVL
jgi:cation:H+ antiporter